MPSPFPGMDPYLEHRDYWGDFHSDLAGEIRSRLNQQVGPKYFARTTCYVTYDVMEISVQTLRKIMASIVMWVCGTFRLRQS